ncbi:DM DNA binding domain protein [Ostertagia ostertagi]
MNIEDIVPELFGEKRVYYCQRCLNHGLRVKRKNHKQNCAYSMCQCSDCIMVERRRELNSRLVQIEGEPGHQSSTESPCGVEDTAVKNVVRTANDVHSTNVSMALKGHKRACPFKECFCPKCQVVVERQKLMADQIKLRRRQKREKSNTFERPQTPAGTTTEVCLKCTQQAIGYQHLMSILDPSNVSETFLNLSAVLQACPHKASAQNVIESSTTLLANQVPSFMIGQCVPASTEMRQDPD